MKLVAFLFVVFCLSGALGDDCEKLNWEEQRHWKQPENWVLRQYQQLSCNQYNISQFKCIGGEVGFDGSNIVDVGFTGPGYFVRWTESYGSEPVYDPLMLDRWRYIWAVGGKTLLWEEVFEHNFKYGSGFKFQFSTSVTAWEALNSTTVLKRETVASRSFDVPYNGTEVQLDSSTKQQNFPRTLSDPFKLCQATKIQIN
eukprot:TRINITY_DN5993_c0_g1_i1.p1 TRINITY_DN5993_c0_g1~~TRINITY_DN5993_c0_g1_i1.p1  ORF type:complete len:212 (-),score=31.89 TRINITY_DN5993_c0_g1_i1:69-665(-)